jgi:hypothetical protein
MSQLRYKCDMTVSTYCEPVVHQVASSAFNICGKVQISGLGYANGMFVLLCLAHRVRHDAPDASHSFSAVVHVEEIKPACPLQLW